MSNAEMLALELTRITYSCVGFENKVINWNAEFSKLHENVLKSFYYFKNQFDKEEKQDIKISKLQEENDTLNSIVQEIEMAIESDKNSFVNKDKLIEILEGKND